MNEDKLRQHLSYVDEALCDFLIEWYGDRCPDFDANCIICQKYALLDEFMSRLVSPDLVSGENHP